MFDGFYQINIIFLRLMGLSFKSRQRLTKIVALKLSVVFTRKNFNFIAGIIFYFEMYSPFPSNSD